MRYFVCYGTGGPITTTYGERFLEDTKPILYDTLVDANEERGDQNYPV